MKRIGLKHSFKEDSVIIDKKYVPIVELIYRFTHNIKRRKDLNKIRMIKGIVYRSKHYFEIDNSPIILSFKFKDNKRISDSIINFEYWNISLSFYIVE